MVLEKSFDGENTFLLARSRGDADRKNKVPFPKERIEVDFEPIHEDEKWKDEPLLEQVKTTVSSLSEKPLRSPDEIFYVIHPKVPPSDSGVETILSRLDAEIIDYLDIKHKSFIVRGSDSKLAKLTKKEKLPNILTDNIHVIRPIKSQDQISSKAKKELEKKNRMAVISIMPNTSQEHHQNYIDLIKKFLSEKNCKIYSEFSEEGLFITGININEIYELLSDSTFIHFVEPVPLGISQQLKNKPQNKSKNKIKSVASGLEPLTKSNELPLVTVLDSGVNEINPLKGIVEIQDSHNYDSIYDISGNNGHGTPVASLLSLGENLGKPKARILSYKIFEKPEDQQSYPGMIQGIKKFKARTRLFLSSVNFKELDPKLESKLDKLVQKENLCFVNSVGNILPEEIEEEMIKSNYPDYISNYQVQSPASAVSIIGVGSIAAKKHPTGNSIQSIAEIGQIAPYSRCKNDNVYLFDCYKPEVVESGANLNTQNKKINYDQVGIQSYNKDGFLVDFFGTSFSAPLFMQKISELESYYGTNIHNVETLKALAFISCKPITSNCSGLGQPRRVLGCDDNHALYYTEGKIKMRGEVTKKYYDEPFSEFTIKVPRSTGRIDLCLVHSDNFKFSNFPTLNTHLKVDVWKTASDSKVSPTSEGKIITNVRQISYSFLRWSMEGKWTFKIHPQLTAKIATRYKKDIEMRYGAAILLSRKSSHKSSISMNKEINNM